MRPLRRLLCTTALLCLAAPLMASPASPKAGVEYLVLTPPQPTDSGKKIEVTEFFAYYCPHCYAFEPALAAWVKKHGNDIVFKRVHIARDDSVMPQQRLFYTLEALGLLDKYHDKVFAAMHRQRLPLDTDEKVFDWAAGAGLPRARFIDTYRSFGVQARMDQAVRKMELYGISQWPMVAIDGRYLTSPYHAHLGENKDVSEAGQQQEALQVMDFLVGRAKADKR